FDSATGKPAAGRWMVSKGTLGMPRWRGDGKELFYLASDGTVMAVPVSSRATFQPGTPVPLFLLPPSFLKVPLANPGLLGDVAADGKRFLFATPVTGNAPDALTVVMNWNASK